jgi:hypothetical protein
MSSGCPRGRPGLVMRGAPHSGPQMNERQTGGSDRGWEFNFGRGGAFSKSQVVMSGSVVEGRDRPVARLRPRRDLRDWHFSSSCATWHWNGKVPTVAPRLRLWSTREKSGASLLRATTASNGAGFGCYNAVAGNWPCKAPPLTVQRSAELSSVFIQGGNENNNILSFVNTNPSAIATTPHFDTRHRRVAGTAFLVADLASARALLLATSSVTPTSANRVCARYTNGILPPATSTASRPFAGADSCGKGER